MIGYYDAVLGLIPVALIGVTGLLYGAGMTLTGAVTPAVALAVLVVAHAMFVRAPVDRAHAPMSAPSTDPIDAPSAENAPGFRAAD